MATMDEILSRALQLSQSERAALAHQLLLSLESEEVVDDWQGTWADEIEARLAAIKRGNIVAEDWCVAVARIRDSLKNN